MIKVLGNVLEFLLYFFAIIGFVTGIGLMTGSIKYYQEPYPAFNKHGELEFGHKTLAVQH